MAYKRNVKHEMRTWPAELTDPTLLWPYPDQYKERQAAWVVFVEGAEAWGVGWGYLRCQTRREHGVILAMERYLVDH